MAGNGLKCALYVSENMAEEDTRKRIEAARLMREAAKLLDDCNPSPIAVNKEIHKLFAPYQATGKNPRQSSQRAIPPPKRQRTSSWAPMFNPLPTWTHRFCFLSDCNANVAPSIVEKEKLLEVGLGEQKITFQDKKGNHEYLTKVLEDKFPLLKKTGGFLICRTASGSQRLKVIPPSQSGYNIPYLRDDSPLRQAVAYIRPLQKSINIDDITRNQQVLVLYSSCFNTVCMYLCINFVTTCIQ